MIRLAVAFALVIVVMRQARQPGLYQTFFSEPGHAAQSSGPAGGSIEPTQDSKITQESKITQDSKISSINDAESEHSNPARDIDWPTATTWVNEMNPELQRRWIETLLMLRRQTRERSANPDESFDWVGVSKNEVERSIALLRDVQSAEQADGREEDADVIDQLQTLARLADQGRLSAEHVPSIDRWASATLDALDRAALSRVQDGTFWTSVDSDAFYLQLARSNEIVDRRGRADAIAIGTLPLLQQPDVYRGQTVRVEGSLQRATQIDASANRAGIERYWKLWVIPNDGGVRPLVLMVPTLPESLRSLLTEDGSLDPSSLKYEADELIAIGRFIKRLPYRSSIGADIAPVVIGRIEATRADRLRPSASASEIANEGSPAEDASPLSVAGWWGIALAIIAGIGFAVLLMRHATAEAAKTRRMRRKSLDREGFDADLLTTNEMAPPSQSVPEDPAEY